MIKADIDKMSFKFKDSIQIIENLKLSFQDLKKEFKININFTQDEAFNKL